MKIAQIVAYAVIVVSSIGLNTVDAAKSRHNRFDVTNNAGYKIQVDVYSAFNKTNHKTKHGKKVIEVGQTVNMPILKTHSISKVVVTYLDPAKKGRKRIKSNFRIRRFDGDLPANDTRTPNSFVTRGTLTVSDTEVLMTTQKAGVTLKF